MLSENSYSNKGTALGMSGAWIKHILRRFPAIPLVTLFGLFLFIHLPLVMNIKTPGAIAEYMTIVMRGTNVLTLTFISYVTVAASALSFDYLHDTASVTCVHSLPVTRGRLFRSSVITGYLMILVPVLISGIALFVISRFAPEYIADICSFTNTLKWLADTLIYMTFSYAVATLAGVLAGSVLMHVLLAFVLEGIPATVILLYRAYMSTFIFGIEFGMDNDIVDLMPAAHLMVRDSMLSAEDAWVMAVYFAIAVLLIVLAGFLYKKIKLEKEKSATVFPIVGDLLAMFFTFCMMSAFGLMFGMAFSDTAESDVPGTIRVTFLIAAAISSVLFYIIFRMIADSSVNIFNMKNLMKFLVFAGITALIFSVTVFDVLGIEKKVPAPGEIERATFSLSAPVDKEVTIKDADALSAVTKLHKDILKNKNAFETQESTAGECTVTINYSLKSGGSFSRMYSVPNPAPDEVLNEDISEVIRTKEYYDSLSNHLKRLLIDNKTVSISSNSASVDIPKKLGDGLIEAWLSDYAEVGYAYHSKLLRKVYLDDNMTDTFTKNGYGSISISGPDPEEYGSDIIELVNVPFGKKDRQTIKYLKKHGCLKDLMEIEKNDKA